MSAIEIWDNILKGNVEKDDPLWQEYVDKAAVFDERMVDEWNKIVDVLLVYVALFITILTSFIARTIQFKRNPADITNDLLIAIYNQQVALANNISILPVDPTSYFNLSQADYNAAVTQNALLYISLSLSLVVSVIALVAKLWLVSYGRQVFSVGSPYDRAMKRQEAYNGILVWNLGGVINMLPVILLIALLLFGFYVYISILAVQATIGHAIGALLGLGLLFLFSTSVVAAFVSGCPFHFAFSDVARFSFEKLQTISKWISCERFRWFRWLWTGTLTVLWVASIAAVAYATTLAPIWLTAFFVPATISIAYSTQHETVHKPQKYKISLLATVVFLLMSLSTILIFFFTHDIVISVYAIGVSVFVFACWMFSRMSKSMVDTGEIDAIAWLLITIPPQHLATFFKKAGQMTSVDSIGRSYRPRLLESLMPLLSPLITSYHAPKHRSSDAHSPQSDEVLNGRILTSLTLVNDDPIDEDSHSKNLEIYIACLARLSEFTDYEGTFWCLREDAMQHPKLERPLRDKLVELASSQRHSQAVRRTATKVLNNYNLDWEGEPLRSPTTTVLERVATFPRNPATSMSNDNGLYSQEKGQADSATRVESEKIEDVCVCVKSEFGDEKIEG